jgi:hypothetical protein
MVCPLENRMNICLSALFLTVAFLAQSANTWAQEKATEGTARSAEQLAKASISYKVIPVQGGGYGYDVFVDGKRVIHQPTIPGQPGMGGFKKKSDSEKVAQLVIRKLKNKEVPPSVTEEELRKLKVID